MNCFRSLLRVIVFGIVVVMFFKFLVEIYRFRLVFEISLGNLVILNLGGFGIGKFIKVLM